MKVMNVLPRTLILLVKQVQIATLELYRIKELYTGTPNSYIRILCTVHCGRNANKPSAPIEVEGKGLQLWCHITVQQKTSYKYIKLERILMIFGFLVNMENTIEIYSYSTPWALFPQKGCVVPEFFVLISSHCSTQILRMRYGGSSSIYSLVFTVHLAETL